MTRHESVQLEMGDYSEDDDDEHQFRFGSSESDEFFVRSRREKFIKSPDRTAYAVITHNGFEQNEIFAILSHMCKAQIALSICFMIHGSVCPVYGNQATYQGLCHMNVVASVVGILTGGIGIGALNRFRWRAMTVLWLLFVIISAVAYLVVVIMCSIWLDALGKLDERTGLGNGLSGVLLLLAVTLGVCFIMTGVFLCHHWKSYSRKYHVTGKFTRSTSLSPQYHSSYHAGNYGSEPPTENIPMTTMQYHVCTSHCTHSLS